LRASTATNRAPSPRPPNWCSHTNIPRTAAKSRRQAQELVTEAVSEIAESRGAIEQAKGMLMLVYSINADAAFDLLRWRSQETNITLRLLAEQIIADFVHVADGGDAGEVLPPREAYDRLLLTAHLRVPTLNV
jgi:ANTAR domain